MISSEPDKNGYICIERDLRASDEAALRALGAIDKLSVTKMAFVDARKRVHLFGVRHAKVLAAAASVKELWLWADVTRRAMRTIVLLPGLEVLDVLGLRGTGPLANFDRARLKSLGANFSPSEDDLLEFAKCRTLQEIHIKHSALTKRSFRALCELPELTTFDAACTCFDDRMAGWISRKPSIVSLDVGSTRITRVGLEKISTMQQLRSLDVWANRLDESDLELLESLPGLEYLSLGTYYVEPRLDPDKIVSILLRMPSLKRVWLDGVRVSDMQKRLLEEKIGSVNVNPG